MPLSREQLKFTFSVEERAIYNLKHIKETPTPTPAPLPPTTE